MSTLSEQVDMRRQEQVLQTARDSRASHIRKVSRYWWGFLYVTGVPTETEWREQGHARTTTRWHRRMTGRATIVTDDDCPVNHQFREAPGI